MAIYLFLLTGVGRLGLQGERWLRLLHDKMASMLTTQEHFGFRYTAFAYMFVLLFFFQLFLLLLFSSILSVNPSAYVCIYQGIHLPIYLSTNTLITR